MPVIQFPLDESHPKRHELTVLLLMCLDGTAGGVKVAVIDTGVDRDWLADNCPNTPKIVSSLDYTKHKEGPFDTTLTSHGSRIIRDISLFAPKASIYSLRVHGANALGDRSNIIPALDWCARNRMSVVNLSLCFYSDECSLERLCRLCRRINTHSIASNMFCSVVCGDAYTLNEMLDEGGLPSLCPSYCGLAWGVASSEVVDRQSDLADQPEGGLSFTTARFSGGVALLRSALPDLDVLDIRAMIQKTCVALGPDVPREAGFGRHSFLLAYFAGSSLVMAKKGLEQKAEDFRKRSSRMRGRADGDLCVGLERIAARIVWGDWKMAYELAKALSRRAEAWAEPLEQALVEYFLGACLESLNKPAEAAAHYDRYNAAAEIYFGGNWPGP